MKKYLSLIIISSLFIGFVAYATVKTKQTAADQPETQNQNNDDTSVSENSISNSNNLPSNTDYTQDVTNLKPLPVVTTQQEVVIPEKKVISDDSYEKDSSNTTEYESYEGEDD